MKLVSEGARDHALDKQLTSTAYTNKPPWFAFPSYQRAVERKLNVCQRDGELVTYSLTEVSHAGAVGNLHAFQAIPATSRGGEG